LSYTFQNYPNIGLLPFGPNVYSVTAAPWGAVGDGVTDDSAAILAAAANVNLQPGAVLFFPPPKVAFYYNSATPITISAVNSIFTFGSVIKGGPATTDCIVFGASAPTSNATQHFVPNIFNFTNGAALAFRGVTSSTVFGAAISNCLFGISFETSLALGYPITQANTVFLNGGIGNCLHSAIQFKATQSIPTELNGGNSVICSAVANTPNVLFWNAPNGLNPDWGPGNLQFSNVVSYQGSAKINVLGVPANGLVISAVINGHTTTYTLNGADTLQTAAAALAAAVNADGAVNGLVIARAVGGATSSSFYVGSILPGTNYSLAASGSLGLSPTNASQATTSPAGRFSWCPTTASGTFNATIISYFNTPSCMLIDHNVGGTWSGCKLFFPAYVDAYNNMLAGNLGSDIFNMVKLTGAGNQILGYPGATTTNNASLYPANVASNTRSTFAPGQQALTSQNCPFQIPAAGALGAGTIKDYYLYHTFLTGQSNFVWVQPQFSQPITILAVEDETVYAGVDGNGPIVGQVHIRLLFNAAVTYVAQTAILRVGL